VPCTPPRISVILVSDYGEPGPKDWAEERAALEAFAAQDLAEPFQIILVEHERYQAQCPSRIAHIAPHTTVHFTSCARSSEMKDAALSLCASPLVAVVEMDSVPAPDWLRLLVAVLDADPAVDVVSGRTTYGHHSSLRRVLALLDRAWMDPGRAGRIEHISNNGALYRREWLARFPYPDEASPFLSARLRNRAMFDGGARAYFEPRAGMVHGFGGLRFAIDVRRNMAFADGREHRAARAPRASMWRALYGVARRRFADEWRDCRRVGRQYLRWYDWPLALVMLVTLRLFELPGALAALRGDSAVGRTSYR
jgi:hypothetical protein